MGSRLHLRSALMRSVYHRMAHDEHLRSLDKSHWYACDAKILPEDVCELFHQSSSDDETETFLETCFEKSDWLLTQVFHAFAKAFLCWFMTRTSINGLLGRGSMFVFSRVQFESLMTASVPSGWPSNFTTLLDLGAGDGKVTDVMAQNFQAVYVTEISRVMRGVLNSKGYKVLEVEDWFKSENPPYFDVISCLNVLDRCDTPVTLLNQILKKLTPNTGILVLAIVLPLNQYVEGKSSHEPSEKISIEGTSFEEQVSSLTKSFFPSIGFQVLQWSRLPYICEGDLEQSFYWLDDAVFILKPSQNCP